MRLSPARFQNDVVWALTCTPPTGAQSLRFDSCTRLVRAKKFDRSRRSSERDGARRCVHGVVQTWRPSTTTSHDVSGSADTSSTSIGPPIGGIGRPATSGPPGPPDGCTESRNIWIGDEQLASGDASVELAHEAASPARRMIDLLAVL